MSTDWFARKLGAPMGTPAQLPQQQPPTSQPQAPQSVPQQPVQQDPNNPDPNAPGSLAYALAQGQTQGGEATKSGKTGVCPGCSGGNYFEFSNGWSCFDCGYPVVQFGSDLGEGGAIQATGGGTQ